MFLESDGTAELVDETRGTTDDGAESETFSWQGRLEGLDWDDRLKRSVGEHECEGEEEVSGEGSFANGCANLGTLGSDFALQPGVDSKPCDTCCCY